MTDFLVPDLGEGLEEATVSSWAVAVGDEVHLNQVLCTLETAKAEVEIPSPYAGRVAELGGEVGAALAVGALLVRISTGTRTEVPNTNGAVRNPVLVGYGAGADADASRRTRSRRPRAKPGVRKLAAELKVDLARVEPGPDGVISRQSVLAAAGGTHATQSGAGYDVLPVRGVHAEMAKRMTLSHSHIPDAHAGVQVDYTRLLDLCGRLGLSPFVLTVRLLIVTLQHHRVLNSTWFDTDDGPRVHAHHGVHLGIAVATSRGLLVPVVHDAQTKTTRELDTAIRHLIDMCREGTAKPADLVGSSFTVSNFGALGLDEGVPMINYPEAAILGMGALKPRAVVIDDELAVRSTMPLTCVFDHRVADGAQVAAFLCELRDLIEAPETAIVDL